MKTHSGSPARQVGRFHCQKKAGCPSEGINQIVDGQRLTEPFGPEWKEDLLPMFFVGDIDLGGEGLLLGRALETDAVR